mmetsp:Transcript_16795/g.23777  ORF Transcript_16795/g.23777 Transcript_16795/m.23777 type:complete len:223 (+) Transcript_16795:792-1460(+)
MAECSESAGSILIPCFSTKGLMTGPPLMRVSLFARAMSFPSLIASMVGSSPAAPTIPVTTVSAEETVAASTIPSCPYTILGMVEELHPNDSRRSFNAFAASGVDIEATLGEYLSTCSAINSTLLPADKASMTKFSGQASTISSVCVPIDPVDPSNDKCLVNVDPFKDSSRVSLADAAEFTGAAGRSSHPSPVPLLPDITPAAFSDEVMEEDFVIICCCLGIV